MGDHLYSSDRPVIGVDLALSVVASTILKSPDHCHKIDFITDNCAYFLYSISSLMLVCGRVITREYSINGI